MLFNFILMISQAYTVDPIQFLLFTENGPMRETILLRNGPLLSGDT